MDAGLGDPAVLKKTFEMIIDIPNRAFLWTSVILLI